MDTTEQLANIHPGEIIREEWLVPLGKSVYWLAKGLQMPQIAVSEILKGERRITGLTAHKLSRFLGCSAEFWLGLQADYDAREAWRKHGDQLQELRRYDESEPETYPRQIPVIEEDGAPAASTETPVHLRGKRAAVGGG
jgi:addiction module HigA family antidote